MNDEKMWVHYTAGILKNCRTAHLDPEVPEGEEIEPEELLKKIEEADPYEPRLKSIEEDRQVVVSKNQRISPWVVRLMGDSTEYLQESGKSVCNAVVVVRSLHWPGSYNFYCHGRYLNIYVGNGHKYEETSYFPVHPPTVRDDPNEYEVVTDII